MQIVTLTSILRLADELREEQELAMQLERDKKLLEAQVGTGAGHAIREG